MFLARAKTPGKCAVAAADVYGSFSAAAMERCHDTFARAMFPGLALKWALGANIRSVVRLTDHR